jgi:hypothetical protein
MKTTIATSVISVLLLAAAPEVSAQTVVVAIAEGHEGETIAVPVRAQSAPGIAAAACRAIFDAGSLDVSVTSTLFADFATQFRNTGVVEPDADSVTVAGETFTAPLVVRPHAAGLSIAGARRLPSPEANPVIFTLQVSLKAGASPGLYPITLGPALATATGAGYPAGGEAVPLLLGYDAVTDTYPVLAQFTPNNDPVSPGSARFLPEDTDGDGLADAWERRYYGSLTANSGATDTDGDGLSALLEQLFATDPTKANGDAAAAVSLTGDAFEIQFPLLVNTRVAVEWSTDAAAWSASDVTITPRPDLGNGPDWTMHRASVPAAGRSRLLLRVRGVVP